MSEPDNSRRREEEIEKFLKTTEWRRAKDGKGRTYYYMKGSKSTQWTAPEELVEFEKTLDAKLQSKEEGNEVLILSDVKQSEAAVGKAGNDSSVSLISADSQAIPSTQTISSSVSATPSVSSLQQSIKVPVKIVAAKIGQKPAAKNPFGSANYESDDDEDHVRVTSKDAGSHKIEGNVDKKAATSSSSEERNNRFSPEPEREDRRETEAEEETSRGDDEDSKKRGAEGDPILGAKDSIANPIAIEHARKKVKEDPSLTSEVLNSFVSHYTGYLQLSNILVEWLAYADHLTQIKGSTSANANNSSPSFGSTNTSMQSVQERKYEQLLCQLLSSRFSRKVADESDSLLNALEEGEEGGWLRGLVRDETVSDTVQDLHKKYPDSSFLSRWTRLIDEHLATNISETEAVLMDI